MTDKSAKSGNPKGTAYCDTPGTSCYYGEDDKCVNCERPKGHRKTETTKCSLDFIVDALVNLGADEEGALQILDWADENGCYEDSVVTVTRYADYYELTYRRVRN